MNHALLYDDILSVIITNGFLLVTKMSNVIKLPIRISVSWVIHEFNRSFIGQWIVGVLKMTVKDIS